MKRRYYLRGLGIGILITALVFIIAGPSELSDEEIIKRAEELGYTKVEAELTPSIGLKDLLETGTPAPTKAPEVTLTITPAPSEPPLETPEPTPTEIPVPTESPTDIPTPTPTVTPTPTQVPTVVPTEVPKPATPPVTEVITAVIVVERGNTATVVCNKIEEAGILKDGKVLRTYLVDNNLTDYINIGQYTLSSDMSIEEMAELLTER